MLFCGPRTKTIFLRDELDSRHSGEVFFAYYDVRTLRSVRANHVRKQKLFVHLCEVRERKSLFLGLLPWSAFFVKSIRPFLSGISAVVVNVVIVTDLPVVVLPLMRSPAQFCTLLYMDGSLSIASSEFCNLHREIASFGLET